MSEKTSKTIAQRLYDAINKSKNKSVSIARLVEIINSASDKSYYLQTKKIIQDFLTAPETSQLFGEMLGIWVIEIIERFKKVALRSTNKALKINLIELGPGTGKLMHDVLRVLKLRPEIYENINCLHFVEINPNFILLQRELLKPTNKNIIWHNNIDQMIETIANIGNVFNPQYYLMIANEFFDALPINQFIKQINSWVEVVVTATKTSKAAHVFQFSQKKVNKKQREYLDKTYYNLSPGSLIEIANERNKIIYQLGKFFTKHPSMHFAGLIIDYGYDVNPQNRIEPSQNQSSLQSIKSHKYQNILTNLESDISSHVDFCKLKKAALESGLRYYGSIRQADLLKSLGIDYRISILLSKITPLECQIAIKQFYRLMEMKAFRVLAITNSDHINLNFISSYPIL